MRKSLLAIIGLIVMLAGCGTLPTGSLPTQAPVVITVVVTQQVPVTAVPTQQPTIIPTSTVQPTPTDTTQPTNTAVPATSTPEPTQVPIATKAPVQPTSTQVPTAQPTPPPTQVPSGIQFTFPYNGLTGWGISEGDNKDVGLGFKDIEGNPALYVGTQLGSSQEIFRHTEVSAYLDRAYPDNMDPKGPYNWEGKTLTCRVRFESNFSDKLAYVRVLVKDTHMRNQFMKASVDITASNVDKWIPLSLVIGRGEKVDTDDGFDPTQIEAIVIRVDTHPGAPDFTGNFLVDDVVVK